MFYGMILSRTGKLVAKHIFIIKIYFFRFLVKNAILKQTIGTENAH